MSNPDGPQPGPGDLGLVLTGGGARAAYQVGVLRYLSKRFPDLSIPIITGVSAGAINAAHLAAHHGTFRQAGQELGQLWSHLTVDDVFRTDFKSLYRQVIRWSKQLVSGGSGGAITVRGLVDTDPLRGFLTEALHAVKAEITGIRYNLEIGRLKAVALSTSNYSTGQSVTWVQGRGIAQWERPNRRSRVTTLTIEHVMASAALPLMFPAVQIGAEWYGDGGIRLTAPLSPALHLGAARILAISTRHDRTFAEANVPSVAGYPPPAQIAGVLMNAVFLDLLDQDAHRLRRINGLLEGIPNREDRMGMRTIRLVTMRPSVDLGKLANQYEPELPKAFRFMTRGLGTKETDSPDFLSLVMFQPNYLQELIAVGEADAEEHFDDLARLIAPGAPDTGSVQGAPVRDEA
ncbi:MAG: patatin-like phospholipase family protein [Gemmatimonadota bacterium]|nr:patatin-like phospholipase family protein [Gemmatimonadota bacterium]